MPRSERLRALITRLRQGGTHRAEDLARATGVTTRTIYRDMEALSRAGLPVAGTRGAGYRVTADITLPPINLGTDELEALHLGLAVMQEAADPELQAAAARLAAKLDAALPENHARAAEAWGLDVRPFADAAAGFAHIPALRAAIRARQKLEIIEAGEARRCILRPLRLEYWGRVWTLTAWCETRNRALELRVDRIAALDVLPELFTDEPGKRLEDYAAGQSTG